jgi:hypothetical protein
MKYVIVHTWNGEGYSSGNTAEVMEFSSDDKAQQYIVEQAQQEANALAEFTEEWGNVSFDDDEDQGSVQWFAFTTDTYGVVIRTNVNEAQLVNEQEYHEQLKAALAQADPEEEVEDENPFISAYDGEYDYQFIKF